MTITLSTGNTRGMTIAQRQALQALREELAKQEQRNNRLRAHNHRRSLIARGIIRTKEA